MFFNGKTNSGTERVISRSRRFRIVSTGAFSLLAILTLLAVFPIAKHREDAEATTVPATTSLSIISSKDTASVDITPTSKDGTFAISAAADQAEFSVTTDNLTGYSVTLLGSDTSGQLVNNITGDTLDTITSTTTESDFRTGSASTYANKWGYRLNVNNTTTTDFMAAPTTNTAKTIYSTNAPNTTGTSDNFTLALGARVDYEKQTGTYTNTFVLTAVGNPITYKITYWDDTDKLGEDGQANITASKFTISQADPTKAGAVFKGWCYGTADYSANPTACSGTPAEVYNNGDDFTFTSIPSTGTAEANLYAMWEEFPEIQNLDPSLCTATPRKVVDKRDGKVYTVAKLADGQCWMTSDLNLAGGTVLNADTSDVPTNNYYTLPASSATGFDDDTKAFVYNTGNETTNQADCTSTQPCNSYYSWLAATAGGKSARGAAVTGNGYNAAYSICPKGWRLPTVTAEGIPRDSGGYTGGDFYKMILAVKGVTSLPNGYYANPDSTPTFNTTAGPGTLPNFLLAGYYISSTFDYGGSNGYYWSSSSYSSTNAYRLYFSSLSVYSALSSGRYYGFSVRCVMRETMQNFSSQDADAMAVGESKILEDERDGKKYTVAKLADGNVWMTSNLNLAGGTTLNASDSNVPTDNYYTLPASSTTGFDDDTKAFVYNTGNETTNCTSSQPCNSYYSWLAATAGGKDASGNAVTGNGEDAPYSICPKGWKLPKSGNQDDFSATSTTGYKKGDFYKLATTYGANLESQSYQNSAVFYNNAGPGTLPNFLLAGRYLSSTFKYGGTDGYYWSSSSYSSTYAYGLYFTSSSVFSAIHSYRRYGWSVRCVKDDNRTVDDITYMQQINPQIVANTTPEVTYTLKDARDNKDYTVAKLLDGQLWMTSDLNLAGGTVLNAATSDVPTDGYYTLPASSSTGFSSDTVAYVYNSGNETTDQADCYANHPCNSYYSWLAATVGGKNSAGTVVTSNGYNAAYSICPKEWRLPTATTSNANPRTSPNWKTGDLYKLATAYGANLESSYSESAATFYTNAGPGTTPNFLLTGTYNNSAFTSGGSYGTYWVSTVTSSTSASDLGFSPSVVYSAGNGSHRLGFPVRCIAR
ncbi:hypothetical protein IKG07_01135 [Candidatus Saccharibacteria bacterium]|nr:hypothetical protein [Candidatus Saccharibacteria bacterium]